MYNLLQVVLKNLHLIRDKEIVVKECTSFFALCNGHISHYFGTLFRFVSLSKFSYNKMFF